MRLIWNFPLSGHSIDNGVEGTGVDQFNNEPYSNLARETIQNALDARENRSGKAKVEFHLFSTDVEKFPGYEDYFKMLTRIKKSLDNNKDASETEITFINTALEALKPNKKLIWLRVSDYNTKGLTGAYDIGKDNTAFHAFIKGSGKNFKDEFSGGSKGLGKNAIFVNSLLQTMIVSTRTIDKEVASIGVAKLKSFKVEQKGEKYQDYTQGTGFCVSKDSESKKYNLPVKKLIEIQEGYVRKEGEFGTDIYIPAFVYEPDWMRHIVGETILSFIPALLNDELEVIVSSEENLFSISIDKDSVQYLVNDPSKFKSNVAQKEAVAIFNTLNKAKPLKNDGCKDGFELTLYLNAESNSKNSKLYTYRLPTKMKIETRTLDDAFIPCTGVLFVEGKEITSRLRSVEDATHAKWSISRYNRTQYSKAEIKEALDEIETFVRDKSIEFGDIDNQEESDFDWGKENGWVCQEETGTLSAVQKEDSGLPTDEVKYFLRDDPITHKKRKKVTRKKAAVEQEESDVETWQPGTAVESEFSESEVSHPTGHNGGKGGDYHIGEEQEKGEQDSTGKKMMVKVPILVASSKMPSVNPNKGWFKLYFTSGKSCENAEVEIYKVGVDGKEDMVKVKSATYEEEDLDVSKNKFYIGTIRKGKEYIIDLTLDVNENFMWGINIYGED